MLGVPSHLGGGGSYSSTYHVQSQQKVYEMPKVPLSRLYGADQVFISNVASAEEVQSTVKTMTQEPSHSVFAEVFESLLDDIDKLRQKKKGKEALPKPISFII